jgi:hypothetical protein
MSPAMRNASGDGLPCWKLLLIGATVCIIAAIPARAHVHHGRDGTKVDWYPYDCCHDGDCHPVSRLKSLADGFVMTTENGATLFVPARNAAAITGRTMARLLRRKRKARDPLRL